MKIIFISLLTIISLGALPVYADQQRCLQYTMTLKHDDVLIASPVLSARINEVTSTQLSNDRTNQLLTINVEAEDFDNEIVKVTIHLEFFDQLTIEKFIDESTTEYVNLNHLDSESMSIYVSNERIELMLSTALELIDCPTID